MSDRPQPSALLRSAYSPDAFATHAANLTARLQRHLGETQDGKLSVVPNQSPDEMLEQVRELLQADDPAALLDGLLERVHLLHHPRFFCAQVSPPVPLAALLEGVVALVNNSSAVFEMGPASAVLERFAVEWIARRVGYPSEAYGVMTNGGSAGNLTALLALRQVKAGYDVWKEGAREGHRFTVLVSEQAHYCMRRATQILGWGECGATPVETDHRYRMTGETMRRAFDSAIEQGLIPLAVCASACTTSTGSYDPLTTVADFCQEKNLWMHVDGAHGVPAVLSPRYQDRLEGLSRADSIVVDFHKMMLMPVTTTAVLFRNGNDSYRAFDQQASYLFGDSDGEKPWYQGAMRTLECTKRNMGLAFWLTLRTYGEELFRDHIDHTHDLAQAFATLVDDDPRFELAIPPQSNIVCFRHLGSDELDDWQSWLRERVNHGGQASIGTTRLRDGVYLRVVFMNPLSTFEDAVAMLETICEAGGSA